ncbi:MAG: amino acid ABC transporter ATP-binding protein [Planctomycetota bacterium]|nr:amino acid ABC transporter ATP-binding protein [Planctomycetota bacterium]
MELDVRPAEVLAMVGPSGGGKSTLLRLINGLEVRDAGDLNVLGTDVPLPVDGGEIHAPLWRPLRQRIGIVFQAFHLYPHKTALENVALAPVHVNAIDPEAARERASALLRRVGLSDKEGSRPRQLSGGQQQRVAIARAMAMDPDILLFDEPTSALDPEMTAEVLSVIRDLAEEHARTLVVVTHEYAFAREAADRVAFLEDARILEVGPAERVLTDPEHPRTRAFFDRVL